MFIKSWYWNLQLPITICAFDHKSWEKFCKKIFSTFTLKNTSTSPLHWPNPCVLHQNAFKMTPNLCLSPFLFSIIEFMDPMANFSKSLHSMHMFFFFFFVLSMLTVQIWIWNLDGLDVRLHPSNIMMLLNFSWTTSKSENHSFKSHFKSLGWIHMFNFWSS